MLTAIANRRTKCNSCHYKLLNPSVDRFSHFLRFFADVGESDSNSILDEGTLKID